MGRSDDSISRRKNKKNRKKQEENSNKVTQRVAAIIAAKKRRQTGKRRLCQGMCYSLPTPEDPFNDKLGKTDPVKKAKKPVSSKAEKMPKDMKKSASKKRSSENDHVEISNRKQKKGKFMDMENKDRSVNLLNQEELRTEAKIGKGTTQIIDRSSLHQSSPNIDLEVHLGCPSKFLIVCLKTVQTTLKQEGGLVGEEKPFFVDMWGIEFWKAHAHGKDVLETSSADASVEQIAWIASTAADTITRKEREGQSFAGPFLLFLVPSQEKASKVRQVCKPLKVCGVHTVSLHSGVSIDHQIRGLKSCEPEFLVSTPERLLELVSLNAVDVSGISMLVIEGLKTSEGCYHDDVESIKKLMPAGIQTVVFRDLSWY